MSVDEYSCLQSHYTPPKCRELSVIEHSITSQNTEGPRKCIHSLLIFHVKVYTFFGATLYYNRGQGEFIFCDWLLFTPMSN